MLLAVDGSPRALAGWVSPVPRRVSPREIPPANECAVQPLTWLSMQQKQAIAIQSQNALAQNVAKACKRALNFL